MLIVLRCEQPRAATAGILGLTQGEAGTSQRGVAVGRGRQRQDANTDRDTDRDIIDDDGVPRDLRTQSIGDTESVRAVGGLENHHELVAAEPPENRCGQRLRHGLGQGSQHRVADGMATRVIDVPEVVNIDQEQRPGRGTPVRRGVDPLAARAARAARDPLGQQPGHRLPVTQPGERVMRGELGELAARPDQLGDVMRRAHDPDWRARVIGEDVAVALEHALGGPVGEVHTVGEFERADLGDRLLQNSFHPRHVVRMYQRPVGVVVEIGVRGVAEHGEKLVRPCHLVGDQVPLPDTRPGDRLDMAEPAFAQPRDLLFMVTRGVVDNLVEKVALGAELAAPGGITVSKRTATDLQPTAATVRRLPASRAGLVVRDDPRQWQPGLGHGKASRNQVDRVDGTRTSASERAETGRARRRCLLRHRCGARHEGEQSPISPDHTAVGRHHQQPGGHHVSHQADHARDQRTSSRMSAPCRSRPSRYFQIACRV